jgi:hypothetical protein
MDSWLLDLSHYFNPAWVCRIDANLVLISNCLFSVFVPQLATLPSDNSTSEWEHVKYLIDHFDSSSKFLALSHFGFSHPKEIV